jgi:serine protease Do
MNESFEKAAAPPAAVTLDTIARQQRVLIASLMFVSLLLGVLIGAVLTRGALADPDNRISISTGTSVPDALSANFANAAAIVEPAVVHIDVKEGDDGPLAREAKGSGVLVTSSGYILTNFHVIDKANKIGVRLYDHREFDAKVIGRDPDTDLAVLKIDAGEALPFARFGDSDKLRVGDWVLAVGSPFGLEQTVTAGIISAKERETEGGASAFQQFLQTDAAINPGNSGGPLVNLNGEVVGINTQIATRTGAFSGIGFALPSSSAIEVYNALVSSGRVNRGFLGIRVGAVTPELAKANGLDGTDGVVITDLSTKDSPAALAGLRGGDIVTEINGEHVRDGRDLIRRIGAMPSGTVVKLTYVRDGNPGTATVKLTDRESGMKRSDDEEQPAVPPGFDDDDLPPGHPEINPRKPAQLGITPKTLTPDLARDRSLEGLTGVLVLDVEAGSAAAEKGLAAGDVIISVNGKRIATEAEYDQRVGSLSSGDQVVLQIARRIGARIERRFIAITLP